MIFQVRIKRDGKWKKSKCQGNHSTAAGQKRDRGSGACAGQHTAGARIDTAAAWQGGGDAAAGSGAAAARENVCSCIGSGSDPDSPADAAES